MWWTLLHVPENTYDEHMDLIKDYVLRVGSSFTSSVLKVDRLCDCLVLVDNSETYSGCIIST